MKSNIKDTEFEEMKQTVQNILDKYLPSDKRFSVEDYNKEQIWYLCRLLLEKNKEKRIAIWDEIQSKLKHAKYEYEKKFYEILEHKEEFDYYISNIKDKDALLNDVKVDNEIDEKLLNI